MKGRGMKKLIVVLVFGFGFLWLAACGVAACGVEEASAHGEVNDVKLEAIVEEIANRQGVQDKNQIDCSKVSEEEFEKVGEALMTAMHPDPKEHEFMDQMMGGEGSESLRAAHVRMGKGYLCDEKEAFGRFRGGMGMMGTGDEWKGQDGSYGLMGGMMSGWGMMGGAGLVYLVLITAFLVSGTAYFIKELVKKK